eukprot:366000-Chlamydomonas_euryale.AAC.31
MRRASCAPRAPDKSVVPLNPEFRPSSIPALPSPCPSLRPNALTRPLTTPRDAGVDVHSPAGCAAVGQRGASLSVSVAACLGGRPQHSQFVGFSGIAHVAAAFVPTQGRQPSKPPRRAAPRRSALAQKLTPRTRIAHDARAATWLRRARSMTSTGGASPPTTATTVSGSLRISWSQSGSSPSRTPPASPSGPKRQPLRSRDATTWTSTSLRWRWPTRASTASAAST